MPKSTKNTRKTNTSRTSKPPVRATSKKSNSKKSSSVVFGRLMPKRRSHWVLLIVVVAVVGALGSWLLYNSFANTTDLTPTGCKLRGRVGEFSDVSGKYLCYSACRPYAGDWVANPNGYGYCSKAISSMTQAKCSSLGRQYIGSVGCARLWLQAAYPNKNVWLNALQCARDSDDYHVTNTYDYCSSGSAPSGSVIIGSMSPVGRGYNGVRDCVAFIKWVLDRHSTKYDGRATGNGGQVAQNLRAAFGYKNVRAPHAVVSMPNGSGSWSPGHVALVDTVRSDGSIVVEESNWGDYYHSGRVISASQAKGLSYAYITDWN